MIGTIPVPAASAPEAFRLGRSRDRSGERLQWISPVSSFRLRISIGGTCLLAVLMLMAGDMAQGKQKKDKDKDKDKAKAIQDLQNIPDGTKADVMFVLDVTGTMQFAIDGIVEGLENSIKTLKGKEGIESVRVGLTVFRDRDLGSGGKVAPNDRVLNITGDPFTFTFGKDSDAFTDKTGEFREIVKKLKAEGGGDEPENSLEAIQLAAKAKTRPGRVTRIMVLITDAPPRQTGKQLDKVIVTTREAMVANKYHHLHIISRKNEQATYSGIWSQDKKGHRVDGTWFGISNQPKAFTGILDQIGKQANSDNARWRTMDVERKKKEK